IGGEKKQCAPSAEFELAPGKHPYSAELEDRTDSGEVDVPAGEGTHSFTIKLSKRVAATPTTSLPPPTTSLPPPTTARPPTTATPPDPPPPVNGKLLVRSNPGKATVFINNENKGQTPAEAGKPAEFDLRAGKYTVRLERDKHKKWEQEVEVKAGKELA